MTIDEEFEAASERYRAGDFAQAEQIFDRIVRAQPGDISARYFLAEISYRRGDLDRASQYLRDALTYDPTNADAQNNLGLILQEKGQLDEAIQCYRKATELDPGLLQAFLNLGNVLKEKGQFQEALDAYRKIIALDPDIPEAHVNLGMTCQLAGRFDEAIRHFRKALELRPGDADMYFNLGIALQEEGLLEEAITHYQKAAELNPNDAEILNNLAFALQENRRPHEALPYYRKALELSPGYATAHWNMSLALLLTGVFHEGWKEYEWRWGTKYLTASRRDFAEPMWDGSDATGHTILLHAEQGFGDTIQFVRYAPMVAARSAQIILECPQELVPLMQNVKGVARVMPRGEPLPPFDLHCPLLSLPLAFGTTLETIPSVIPYLSCDTSLIKEWEDRVDRDATLAVGLAWAGNPGFKQNRYRNCPLGAFSPLADLPGITFYSLQKGAEAKEAKNPPGGMRLVDLTDDLRNFSDTAALIENLDLIISVDTSVAHLGGALGKPVWTLLPFSPEWRWLLTRTDSPWYPTMRLFRQSSHGDWDPVVASIRNELAGFKRHENTD